MMEGKKNPKKKERQHLKAQVKEIFRLPDVELPGLPDVELPFLDKNYWLGIELPSLPNVELPGLPDVKLPFLDED